jgi:hypothetical protein
MEFVSALSYINLFCTKLMLVASNYLVLNASLIMLPPWCNDVACSTQGQ